MEQASGMEEVSAIVEDLTATAEDLRQLAQKF